MAQINLNSFGYNEFVAQATSTKTLAAADSGLVYNTTVTCTYTLPSTVVGYTYLIRVGADGITVAISPAAADNIAGGGYTAVDNKDLIFTSAPAGSYVMLIADGANGWFIQRLDAGGASATVAKEA